MILPYDSLCIDMTASPEHDTQSRNQRRYRHVVVMLCNVWLAESSRAPALWRHYHNVDDQNMVVLPIVGGSTCHAYGRKFAIKIQCEWDEKYVHLRMKI